MDVGTLEQWLWDAACEIRGPMDAPKFKDYILPLVFLKRLSDVFDHEIARLADEFGGEEKAIAVADSDHSIVPSGIRGHRCRWALEPGLDPGGENLVGSHDQGDGDLLAEYQGPCRGHHPPGSASTPGWTI